MTKLPVLSAREVLRALEKAGFIVDHQKGSHIVLVRGNPPCRIVVPNHKEIDRGTVRAIIRQAGITVEEFVRLL
ncbi:MAG: type II toxin-antitoxin system HicA family toxin [Thaumarchaeota archaeon]|nr:type II toxin-antitoxin system HicA family toxin [Nitrososphaerota archaeon]